MNNLPPVKAPPLADPKVENATPSGTRKAIGPSNRLAQSCHMFTNVYTHNIFNMQKKMIIYSRSRAFIAIQWRDRMIIKCMLIFIFRLLTTATASEAIISAGDKTAR